MARHPNLLLAGALILSLTAGSLLSRQVAHLRESEAFYRWIFAAGASARLFADEAEAEAKDGALLEEVANATESLLPDVPVYDARDAGDGGAPLPKVVRIATRPTDETADTGDAQFDDLLWNLVQGDALGPQREEFLAYLREGKLRYAQGINLAEAQEGGVNLFNLFFGFRKLAANFVWLQVDKFWHRGEMYKMIPLMNLCVRLDPNFVDAYLLGAWHLAYNVTAKLPETPTHLQVWSARYQDCIGEKEKYYYLATEFLKDGISHNPRNYKLYFDLGFAVYKQKLEDYRNAVKYLAEAVRHPHERWVPRQLYLSMELNGQYRDALAGWKDYMKRYPEHPVAARFRLRNEAHILEDEADALKAEADQAAGGGARDALLASAQVKLQEARTIYEAMDEPYAVTRLLRLDAIELAAEGRYLEAIAKLEHARWETASFFDEASAMIIRYKQQAGVPLSVSERKWVIREEMGEACQGQPEANAQS